MDCPKIVELVVFKWKVFAVCSTSWMESQSRLSKDCRTHRIQEEKVFIIWMWEMNIVYTVSNGQNFFLFYSVMKKFWMCKEIRDGCNLNVCMFGCMDFGRCSNVWEFGCIWMFFIVCLVFRQMTTVWKPRRTSRIQTIEMGERRTSILTFSIQDYWKSGNYLKFKTYVKYQNIRDWRKTYVNSNLFHSNLLRDFFRKNKDYLKGKTYVKYPSNQNRRKTYVNSHFFHSKLFRKMLLSVFFELMRKRNLFWIFLEYSWFLYGFLR